MESHDPLDGHEGHERAHEQERGLRGIHDNPAQAGPVAPQADDTAANRQPETDRQQQDDRPENRGRPGTDLVDLQKARRAVTVAVDVTVPGEDVAPHKGEVTFIDNSVERGTGTVAARATIANADLSLLPGQYVRVRVHLREQPDALLVPQVAVGAGRPRPR